MDFNIASFNIDITLSKSYTFKVEQTYLSDSIEVFTITYSGREIRFQSDRPFVRRNNSKKKINWKVIEGKVENETTYERIKQELERHIRNSEKPPFDWSTHPKNSPQ